MPPMHLAVRGQRGPGRDFASSPLLAFYELTRACDLACLHCRACAQAAPADNELSSAHSRRLIEQLTDFPQPPLLVLTGGDPFKRPDLPDLVHHATNLEMQVAVTPSATPLVTREALARLWRAGLSRLAVSLDAPDADSHDRFRGVAGSFARTLEIIHDAQSLGLPVQVNTTLTPNNWQRIEEFAALLDGLRITLWSVFFLVPVGRAAAMPRLSGQQVEEAFAQLWHQAKRRSFPIKTTEAPHYRRFVAQQKGDDQNRPQPTPRKGYASLHTNDGKGILFIAHDGTIYPSGFLPIPAGVFPHDHVVEVYQKSPLFQSLRDPDRLEGKCRACEFRKLCGGSRARAYAVTGNPLTEEPDCVYQPHGWPSP
ncbi:MAG TPA: TIGR04053 family radical SAM/SPASM domain-containing protein [Pirellulaceae bacterium]|nr:TIGR04053 family radical SAM/SPASM domain-containing protein [Pirellulaceae bacterium]